MPIEINERTVVGVLFIIGMLMFWLGSVLLPHKVGPYFVKSDFAAVRESFRPWIWIYRLFLFGHLLLVMAVISFAVHLLDSVGRSLICPGAFVACTGLLVSALAEAFYYHYGAWGAQETADYSDVQLEDYLRSLEKLTGYITCWTRFGRVFFGLGAVVLGLGLIAGGGLGLWLSASLALLGLAPMVLTMAFPDNLEYYRPVFHLQSFWFLAAGVVLLLGHS